MLFCKMNTIQFNTAHSSYSYSYYGVGLNTLALTADSVLYQFCHHCLTSAVILGVYAVQVSHQTFTFIHSYVYLHSNTRNSSGDEIANVNFLYDDIVHVLQNTIDSCINSATDRRGYVLERMFTRFSEITQYNGHYAVQGHSRSPILVPIESS